MISAPAGDIGANHRAKNVLRFKARSDTGMRGPAPV